MFILPFSDDDDDHAYAALNCQVLNSGSFKNCTHFIALRVAVVLCTAVVVCEQN